MHFNFSNDTHKITLQEQQFRASERLLREKYKPKDGPFFACLEAALQHLNVERQAYQGGTFVGNHVHKLLKVKIIYSSYRLELYGL